MESKKLNKKYSTTFWWIIYSLPLIVFFMTYIGYLFVFKETGSDFILDENLFYLSMTDTLNVFNVFIWNFISDTLISLFTLLSFDLSGDIYFFVVCLFTWFIQFSFIHILVDFILFIPRALHNLMERWS